MSNGFGGSTTKSLNDVTREVEMRVGRTKLDTFTDDFNPPGPYQSGIGADHSKPGNKGGYGKPHDDSVPEASKSFGLAAAGNEKDQEVMDVLDKEIQEIEGGIKPIQDGFPGAKLPASDNAALDIHATDPMRLRRELHKDLKLMAKVTWVCSECDREVIGPGQPGQCACGARHWKKKI